MQEEQEVATAAQKRQADGAAPKAAAKKFKATSLVPAHADKQVWASIFLGDRKEQKETYSCRSLSSRGMGIA